MSKKCSSRKLMAPGGRRYETRTRWPCWTLGRTGFTTGSIISSTSLVLESGPVGHAFKRIRSVDIYVQSTDFNVHNYFFFSRIKSGNEISTVMCWNQLSVSAGFYFSPRVGTAVGTERNLIHVGWFTKRLNAHWTCVFPFYLKRKIIRDIQANKI